MKKTLPSIYETRIKTKFLLFPKKIGHEIRWLEVASWKEEFRPYYPCDYPQISDGWWKGVNWL
jgi:hypothetical protein